ncbi:hypothetical protein BaRGS_00002637 [Batillaria attramentaria]|uniref:Uncharacterized protein n=1 Tax=Batillaria attramentaria TaxID=370345 RepID=A0ABD0M2F7_9CAEN
MSNSKTEVLRFQIRSKNVLAPDEMELFELAQLAGVTMDPSVFKIILDLLKVNVAPMAIMQMLKLMCDPQQQKSAADIYSFMSSSADNTSSSLQTSTHNRSSRQRPEGRVRQGLSTSSTRLRDVRH